MKKTIIFILCAVMVIISVFWMKYIDYKSELNLIKEDNKEFEMYLNKQISGRDLTTAINRAVNNNETNQVSKDGQGLYIKNDTNSIKIEIKIIDNETTYQMESLYNGGMTNFLQYYGDISFECNKINYNSKGKVCYLCFEQKTS